MCMHNVLTICSNAVQHKCEFVHDLYKKLGPICEVTLMPIIARFTQRLSRYLLNMRSPSVLSKMDKKLVMMERLSQMLK